MHILSIQKFKYSDFNVLIAIGVGPGGVALNGIAFGGALMALPPGTIPGVPVGAAKLSITLDTGADGRSNAMAFAMSGIANAVVCVAITSEPWTVIFMPAAGEFGAFPFKLRRPLEIPSSVACARHVKTTNKQRAACANA